MMCKIPTELYPSGSILFLGAGFSKDALNIQGTELPLGIDLRNKFAEMLNVDPNSYDLHTLAEEINSRQDLNLYQILYRLYTVQKLSRNQIDILTLPWRRIYTTNYDDAVEFASLQRNERSITFDYHEDKPKKFPIGSVIHLHGSIRTTNQENVLKQLVLNEQSYIRQHFEQSPWYSEFIRDLRFCDACYFVGYSLNDYHISALLLQTHQLRNRTYFITKKYPDPIFLNRIAPYGISLPVEVNGFAHLCRTLPKPESTDNLHTLKAFRYIDPIKDKRTLAPPTAVEILNLMIYGTFNYQRCISTLPRAEYVAPRQELVDKSVKELKDARCLLIHSYLGNGKTIFSYILAHTLSEQGYRCFISRTDPIILGRDLEILTRFQKLVIFFDSYNAATEIIEHLSQILPSAEFVVSIRTGIQEVRLHEIRSRLPEPLHRISLNGIQPQDTDNFKNLLDRSGVRVQDMEEQIDRCRNFREIVVSLYDNMHIKERIRTVIEPIFREKNSRNVFISSHLLSWVGQDINAAFLRNATGSDAYAELIKFEDISREFFRFDDDEIYVRSATFSEYLVQNHMNPDDIVDCVYKIILAAVRRKEIRHYRSILSSLMRYSILDRALKNELDRLEILAGLFERLRHDADVNREPLFWLQYSILMTAAGNYQAAEGFIRTAYERAAAIPKFRTFQIDTYALKLFLLIEREREDDPQVSRFEQIIEKLEAVRSMIWEESRRFHAIQVLDEIKPFVVSRLCALSDEEKKTLNLHLQLLEKNLAQLPGIVRGETGSDLIRRNILHAMNLITTNDRL